jgi:hypothetical protein
VLPTQQATGDVFGMGGGGDGGGGGGGAFHLFFPPITGITQVGRFGARTGFLSSFHGEFGTFYSASPLPGW